MTAALEVLSVGIDEIVADPTQPRKTFDKEASERMVASIRARGIQLPLRVLRDAERGCWRLVTGECRWRAAKLAGLTHVPCLPVDGEVSETDILSDQIIENSVRNALRPSELARALVRLKALKECTFDHIANDLGISGAEVSRTASLLKLDESVLARVDDGTVAEGIAYLISRLPDAQDQREMAEAVAAKRMKREAVARAVEAKVGRRNVKPKDSRLTCQVDAVSISLSADTPLQWDSLLYAIRRLQREADRLHKNGDEVTKLAQVLKAS